MMISHTPFMSHFEVLDLQILITLLIFFMWGKGRHALSPKYSYKCEVNENVHVQVHYGICLYYQYVKDLNFMESLVEIATQFPEYHLVFTGHSMGGALVSLASIDFASQFPSRPSTLYTFGAPRTSDHEFVMLLKQYPIETFRVVNAHDSHFHHLSPCLLWRCNK